MFGLGDKDNVRESGGTDVTNMEEQAFEILELGRRKSEKTCVLVEGRAGDRLIGCECIYEMAYA